MIFTFSALFSDVAEHTASLATTGHGLFTGDGVFNVCHYCIQFGLVTSQVRFKRQPVDQLMKPPEDEIVNQL